MCLVAGELRVLSIFAAVLIGVLFCQISAQAAIPPAGYQILSQSSAQYSAAGNQFSVVSNPISTRVLPVYSLQLSPPGTAGAPAFTLQGLPGDTLYATYTVTNTGNARDSIDAFSQSIPPSTTALAQVVFFLDTNGNGRLDAGEDDPTSFVLDADASLALSVALMLTTPVGDTYTEVQVSSLIDPSPVTYTSVVLTTTNNLPGNTLHLGPLRNAAANPGGEGSLDDVTTVSLGYADDRIVFLNDIANLDVAGDVIELAVADTTGWPAGLTVTFRDSTGAALPSAPQSTFGVLVGAFAPGETRTIQAEVTTGGLPLAKALSDSLSIRLRATSRTDTTRVNDTIDRIFVPSADTGAVITLDQTFRENSAAFGDVVTLVITVRNISDSLDVDSLIVRESVQATLNFLSSPAFVDQGGYFTWMSVLCARGRKKRPRSSCSPTVESRRARSRPRDRPRASRRRQTRCPRVR